MNDVLRKCEALRAKLGELDEASTNAHRLRRALSWLERAFGEEDADARCLFFWVAFNASYGVERRAEIEEFGREPLEWQRRERYFARLTRVAHRRIRSAIRGELSRPLERLMSNVYISRQFWDSLTDEPFDWETWSGKERFEHERKEVRRRLAADSPDDTVFILARMFDRLNVLRNQLMHGCATQDGTLNRRQVEDGAEILAILLPLFLDMMLERIEEDWGDLAFPVRDDIREDRTEREESRR